MSFRDTPLLDTTTQASSKNRAPLGPLWMLLGTQAHKPLLQLQIGNSRASGPLVVSGQPQKTCTKFAYELFAENGKINDIGTIMKDLWRASNTDMG